MCKCGHPRRAHKPYLNLERSIRKSLQKLIFEKNKGWLYKDLTESVAVAAANNMRRLIKGHLDRARVYRIIAERYR